MTTPLSEPGISSQYKGNTSSLRSTVQSRKDRLSIEATDGELLALFTLHKDESAFDQLVERHASLVWRVATQVLRNSQDAEDVFQATFLLLATKAHKIRASESAASWLYRVAHRTAVAAWRKSVKRKEQAHETEPLAPEHQFPDLIGRQTAAIMMEELALLPKQYQAPLIMRYLEGESRSTIANQTDTTVATVQGLLARGKKLLRQRLIRRGVSLSAAMTLVASGSAQAESLSTKLVTSTKANAWAMVHGNGIRSNHRCREY